MKKPKEMSDYEKTVALAAAQLYAMEMYSRVRNLKEGKSISIDEVISESVCEAIEIVDGVLECTR